MADSPPTPDRSGPPLVCPTCRVELDRRGGGAMRCPACVKTFPEVAGIPDLRLVPDRYLDLDADRAKAEWLAGRDELSFAELVDAYWRTVPEVPASLAARYAATAVDGRRRGHGWLDHGPPVKGGDTAIDVGCGTGGLVAALAERGARATGVDIALRWLVVAARQCAERGLDVRLVAADGAVLPFQGASFAHAWSVEALEHAVDQRGLLQSCLLSVKPAGHVTVVTANRFSLTPEPTVGLLGVGFLPRRLAAPYVRQRRHTRYQFVRPLSASELGALVGPRRDVAVGPASLPVPPLGASSSRRWLTRAYERFCITPGAREVLSRVGPFLQVAGRVEPSAGLSLGSVRREVAG